MCLTAQPGEAAGGIDGADVRADLLECGESAALVFDLADDVFADSDAQVGGGAGEPFALFDQEVGGYALGLLLQVAFVAAGFVQGGDGFVDLVALHARTCFEPVCRVESGARRLLGLGEFAEENVAVGQGFFHDEGIARSVC